MPKGDRTGPMGLGPRSGRAAGYCAGFAMPGYMNPGGGRLGMGFAWGHGRGYAWRRSFFPPALMPFYPAAYAGQPYGQPVTREEEKAMLQNQAKMVQDQLNVINQRIAELEKSKEE